MKRKTYAMAFLMAVIIAAALLSNWSVGRADQPGKFGLQGDFEVTIDEGPTAHSGPVKVAGILTLAVSPTGSFVGKLTPFEGQGSVVSGDLALDNPQAVRAVGQVNGRAYNIMLDLGGGRFVSGVGTSLNVVSKRGDAVGFLSGPAVGPQPGDRGDWSSGGGYVATAGLSYQQYLDTIQVLDGK
jgi:hypothetical protein